MKDKHTIANELYEKVKQFIRDEKALGASKNMITLALRNIVSSAKEEELDK